MARCQLPITGIWNLLVHIRVPYTVSVELLVDRWPERAENLTSWRGFKSFLCCIRSLLLNPVLETSNSSALISHISIKQWSPLAFKLRELPLTWSILSEQFFFIKSDVVKWFAALHIVSRNVRVNLRILHWHRLIECASRRALGSNLQYRALRSHRFHMLWLNLGLSFLYFMNARVSNLSESGAFIIFHYHWEFAQSLLGTHYALWHLPNVGFLRILSMLGKMMLLGDDIKLRRTFVSFVSTEVCQISFSHIALLLSRSSFMHHFRPELLGLLVNGWGPTWLAFQ